LTAALIKDEKVKDEKVKGEKVKGEKVKGEKNSVFWYRGKRTTTIS
jgi:hypothetical protein